MTKPMRLMDTPADFAKFGINPKQVELWESGRRVGTKAGENEVWYFDGNFSDGSKFMVGFRPKDPYANHDYDRPNVNIMITTPEGELFHDFTFVDAKDGSFSKNQCDVKVGKHYAKGDWTQYDIHFEADNGVGLTLHYQAITEPFRQGTAHIGFGENDEFFHTDLAVPKSKITGTLTAGGKTWQVEGFGYHDRQWMNTSPMALYHHWFWGRAYCQQHTVYIYDFVGAEQYGFKRIPMFGVYDQHGKIIFKTNGKIECQTELAFDPIFQKDLPKISRYIFDNGDQKAIVEVEWKQQLEIRPMYLNATAEQKAQYDAMNIEPNYGRYFADVKLTLIDNNGTQSDTGDMIYEYAYFGKTHADAGV